LNEHLRIPIAGAPDAVAQTTATLAATRGIDNVVRDGGWLVIDYDVRLFGCADIIEHVQNGGCRINLNRWERMRLGFRCYREAIRRDEHNNEIGWDSSVREIYVSRYRHRRHGRRDDRPRNWRQYGARPPG